MPGNGSINEILKVKYLFIFDATQIWHPKQFLEKDKFELSNGPNDRENKPIGPIYSSS